MNKSGSKDFHKLIEALGKSGKQFQSAADEFAQEMAERRKAFEEKQRNIEESIRDGAKLTKHRISL
ncbi:hypothetical protein [Chitiniphilus eburneus]|uniref:Uncharacterized protein n=1 Tax=Chitiniphilus eburneus TaxID=2571148 RepID=A0A4U0Q3D9_9NEIS|nr:hypothetical protein [Chitiniphilus eburneus]TJZ75576.1 hypothetical protein FAZ21_06575 [Chitiniphilus eburneus]